MIRLLSIVSLVVVSACEKPGDFCDVAEPILFTEEVAVAVVAGDRETAEVIDAHNRYGERFCRW